MDGHDMTLVEQAIENLCRDHGIPCSSRPLCDWRWG
jgi:hypothetical protein